MFLRPQALLALAAALLLAGLLGCADNGTVTFPIDDDDRDGIENDLDENDDDVNLEHGIPGDVITRHAPSVERLRE